MSRNPKIIILCWGGIFTLAVIITHLLIHYKIQSEQVVLRNLLDIIGVAFSCFCIYKAVHTYRAGQGDDVPFVALKGLKLSMGLLSVFFVLFLSFSMIFYNYVDANFVADYKTKKIEFVQKSDLQTEQKEQTIKTIQSLTASSYAITDTLQRLIFPVMGMLFVVAFLQRKPVKVKEVKDTENQQ